MPPYSSVRWGAARFRAGLGDRERKLAVRQARRAQRIIETPCGHPCRLLEMKTEARVANLGRCLKRGFAMVELC